MSNMNDTENDLELDQGAASSSQMEVPNRKQQHQLFPPPPPPLVLDMDDVQTQCSLSPPSPSPPPPPPQVCETDDDIPNNYHHPTPQWQGKEAQTPQHHPLFSPPPDENFLQQLQHPSPYKRPLSDTLSGPGGVPAVRPQPFPPGSVITQNQIVSDHVTLTGGIKVDNKEIANQQGQLYELLKRACTPFVETSGYIAAKACLESSGRVTLIGEAGSGKTTIGYRLLKLYKDSKTFTPLIVEDAAELKRLRDPKTPTLVFINDVFGRSAYSATKLEMWLPVFEQLQKTLNPNKFRIIFSSRNYIFKEALSDVVLYKDFLFEENTRVDLSGDATLLQDDKEKLLRVFAKRADVPIKDDDLMSIVEMKTTYGFPLACYLFSKLDKWHSRPQEFFREPFDVIIETVQHLYRHDKNKFAILLLVLLSNGKFRLAKLRKSDHLLEVIQDYTSVQRISELVSKRHEIASPLIGSFLTSIGDTLSFRHPTVEDTVAYVIGKSDPLFMIEHCSMRVLYERLRIHTSRSKSSLQPTQADSQWFHVILSDDYHGDLISRFVLEIKKQNFPLVCLHQACTVKSFVDELFTSLRSTEEFERTFHSRDPEHQQNMLYWCAMNRSSQLFNKIIEEASYNIYETHNALIACCIIGNSDALRIAIGAISPERRARLFNMSVIRKNMAVKDDDNITDIKKHEIYDDRLLNIASRFGHKDAVKVLVEAGFSVRGDRNVTPPLHSCCEGGHVYVLTYIHDQGADLETKMFDGKTPLHVCCTNGHLSTAQKCVELGSSVETKAVGGMTPLLTACRNGYEDIAQHLIDHGASLDAKDNIGRDCLYYACHGGCEDILHEILKSRKCEVANIEYGRGITLLHGTARKTRLGREDKKRAITLQLIDLGADVCAVDDDGMSPLLVAAESGYTGIVNILLKNGASPSVKTTSNQTFLHKAAQGGLIDQINFPLTKNVRSDSKLVETILLDALLSVDEVDAREQTPLYKAAAAWSERARTVQTLIKYKANVNAVDVCKNTPLHVASVRGHADTAEILLENGADVNAGNDRKQTPLHLAAEEGMCDTIKVLVENEADVNAIDETNQTALHVASKSWWGGVDTVDMLLDHGADINAVDASKQTPLHLAVGKWGRVDTAQALIDNKADVNAVEENEQTPLHLAAQKGYIDLIQLLVDSNADVDAGNNIKQTPLHLTAEEGTAETVQVLLDCKADVNAMDALQQTPLHLAARQGRNDNLQLLLKNAQINAKDESGQTPLHLAASEGRDGTVRLLVENNADVNAIDDKGRTLLHTSAEEGRYGAVCVLLENGTDVRAKDVNMRTPLHLAAESQRVHSEDVVKTLLTFKADVDAVDENKQTPLHLATLNGSSESVQVLIDFNADINSFDGKNKTPLHLAAAADRSDIVQVLLHNKTQMNISDENNQTPLHMAANKGHTETVKVFMRHKADVDALDKMKRTPLHLAAMKGKKGTVQVLLTKGANVNAVDEKKQTPLHLAADSGSTDTVTILLKNKANIHAVDDNAMTAFGMAVKNNHLYTVQLLRKALATV